MQAPPNLSPQQQQEVVRLQQLQQSLEMIMQQKATMDAQAKEMDFAASELEAAPEDTVAYKSVGGIFIKKDRNELLTSTTDRKETLEIRVKSLTTQETTIKAQYESQRAKVQEMFKAAGIQ